MRKKEVPRDGRAMRQKQPEHLAVSPSEAEVPV